MRLERPDHPSDSRPGGADLAELTAAEPSPDGEVLDRVRVVVPTTQGPAIVLRITEEDPAVRSVICLNGTSKTLPISRDYDAFVREPTGVVERAVGHAAFRVDLDRAVDEGDSWQLAIFIAHLLKGAGRLAEGDSPADRVLWATGTVDRDLNVGPVEKVKDKLDASAAYLGGLTAPFLAAVPARTPESFRDPSLLPVAKADELWAQLGPDAGMTSAKLVMGAKDFRKKMRRKIMGWVALAIAGGILLAEVTGYESDRTRERRLEQEGVATGGNGDGGAEAGPSAPPINPVAEVAPSEPAPIPAFDPATVAVMIEAGPASVLVTARNDGAVTAHAVLLGRVDGAFREYAEEDAKFADRMSAVLAPGETVTLTVDGPGWVRRNLTGLGIAIVSGRALTGVEDLDPSLPADRLESSARARASTDVAVTVRSLALDSTQ